jgi:hypothetical protein
VFLTVWSLRNYGRLEVALLNTGIAAWTGVALLGQALDRPSWPATKLLGMVLFFLVSLVFGAQSLFSWKRGAFSHQWVWTKPTVLLRRWLVPTTWRILAGCLMAVLLYLACERIYWQKQATALRFELIQKGEKLSLKELVLLPTPSEQTNYQRFVELSRALPAMLDLRRCVRTSPETALPSWHDEVDELSPDKIKLLNQALQPYQTNLSQAGDLLPGLRLSYGPDGALFGRNPISKIPLIQHLSYLNQQQLRARQFDEAVESLLRLVRLAQAYQQIPTAAAVQETSQLITLIGNITWETLSLKGCTDSQLERLQRGLNTFDPLVQGASFLRIVAARDLELLDQCRQSRNSFRALAERFKNEGKAKYADAEPFEEFLAQTFYYPCWRLAWSYQDEYWCLRARQWTLEVVKQYSANEPASVGGNPPWEEQLRSYESIQEHWGYFFTSLKPWRINQGTRPDVAPYRDALEAATRLRLATAAVAIHRYYLAHQTWPQFWSDLVPRWLTSTPMETFPKQALAFRASSKGQPFLYSAGLDGVDNEGWGDDIAWPLEGKAEFFESDPIAEKEDVIPLCVFDGAPLSTVIESLAKQAGIEHRYAPCYSKWHEGGVSLRLENVTASQVLVAFLANYNLVMVKNFRGLWTIGERSQVPVLRTAPRTPPAEYPWEQLPSPTEQMREMITFDSAPLANVISSLARQSHLNFVFDPKFIAAAESRSLISWRETNTTPVAVLRKVLAQHQLRLLGDERTHIGRITYKQ